MDNRRNYYRILHVQPDAPTEIIRMSYLTLMRRLKMHPDLGGDHAEALLINEAFATLIDPAKREVYDRTLARERAMPGYRSDPVHRDDHARPVPPAAVADPHACAFCGTRCHSGDLARVEALCSSCESPLYPAARHQHDVATRRAISRVSRRLPVTFYLSWPQRPGFSAVTQDISISGMRLTTVLDLVPNERLKVECAFCSSVAVVRHAHPGGDGGQSWDVGIEFLTLLIKPVRGVLVSTTA